MPLYRSTHEQALDLAAAREAAGETLVSIATDDGGIYIATAPSKLGRVKPGQTEKR